MYVNLKCHYAQKTKLEKTDLHIFKLTILQKLNYRIPIAFVLFQWKATSK